LQLTNLMKIEKQLKNHPKIDRLRIFLQEFFKKYTAKFIILFGSAAKKTYNYKSDLDLLIVTNSLSGNFIEKLYKMQQITPGGIDFFVYSSDEFEKMVNELHLVALEALDTGIIIFDRGVGEKYGLYIKTLKESGKIQKLEYGWKINL